MSFQQSAGLSFSARPPLSSASSGFTSPSNEKEKKKNIRRSVAFPYPFSPSTSEETSPTLHQRVKKEKEKDAVGGRIHVFKERLLKTEQVNRHSIGGEGKASLTSSFFRSSRSQAEDQLKSPLRTPRSPDKFQTAAQRGLLSSSKINIEKMANISADLLEFAQGMQKHVQELNQNKEKARKEDKEEFEARSSEIVQLGRKILSEELGEQWARIRLEIDLLLRVQEGEESSLEGDLHILELEKYLQGGNEKSLKSVLEEAKKSLKGDKYRETTLSYLKDFLVDITAGAACFADKAFIKKLKAFGPPSKEMPNVVFHYIKNLVMIAETLKLQGNDLMKAADKEGNDLAVLSAKKYVQMLHQLKDVKKSDEEDRRAIVNSCCKQCGEYLLRFAKKCSSLFATFLLTEKEYAIYTESFFDPLQDKIKSMLLFSDYMNFKEDFNRAAVGKYLSLSTDQLEFFPPALAQKMTSKDYEVDFSFYRDLLDFFILHLQLSSKELERFHPIEELNKLEKIDAVFRRLEAEWKRELILHFFDAYSDLDASKQVKIVELLEKATHFKQEREDLNQSIGEEKTEQEIKPEVKLFGQEMTAIQEAYELFKTQFSAEIAQRGLSELKGVFKLLPLLKAFNQAILYGIHFGAIALDKNLGDAQQKHKIIRELPLASSVQTRARGEKLDREVKKIDFAFKDDTLLITLWRQGALEKRIEPSARGVDASQELYPNCLINSTVTLQTTMSDIHHWDVNFAVEIERPKSENMNPSFLERYAALIVALNLMGMPYTVQDV